MREAGTRGNTGRRRGVAAALAACALVAAGCSSTSEDTDTLQRARADGAIKIGIAGEVPYGFTEDGQVTGEAPEVAKEVFANLGIEQVSSEQVAFGQLIPALNAGQFDMVAAGMAILPERCANAAFSTVDYVTPEALLVPEGNPDDLATFDDIKDDGLQVAVLSGSIEQAVAEDTGIDDDDIQTFDDQAGIFQAIADERADAGSLTDISLKTLVEQNPDAGLEVTDGFVPVVDGQEQIQAGGFVFRRGDQKILDAFNTELDALQDSGRWLEIASPFGFTEDNLPSAELTTAELCQGNVDTGSDDDGRPTETPSADGASETPSADGASETPSAEEASETPSADEDE